MKLQNIITYFFLLDHGFAYYPHKQYNSRRSCCFTTNAEGSSELTTQEIMSAQNENNTNQQVFIQSDSKISIDLDSEKLVDHVDHSQPEQQLDGDSKFYISCSSCRCIYVFQNAKELNQAVGSRGARVKCAVCDKIWFQSMEKVSKFDTYLSYLPVSREKSNDLKKLLADNNWIRAPKGEKVDLFVGNLPYAYDENDISDLFAEYGVVSVTMVRDADRQSKGFAFVELGTREDAEVAISEMHGFHLDNQRKLVVKLSIRATAGPAASNAPSVSSQTSGTTNVGVPPQQQKESPDGARSIPARSWQRPVSGGGGNQPAAPGSSGAKNVWTPKTR